MKLQYTDEQEAALLKQLGNKFTEKELTAGTAESCTGGRIASLLAALPNSSEHFMGGIVSYSVKIKKKLLGVSENDLEESGVVSRPVAEQMATGACRLLECSCAVSTTGFAGPDGGTPENPVGTVWIAATVNGKIRSERFLFEGDRQEVVGQSSYHALRMLLDMLDQ